MHMHKVKCLHVKQYQEIQFKMLGLTKDNNMNTCYVYAVVQFYLI